MLQCGLICRLGGRQWGVMMLIWASLKPKDLVSVALRIGRDWLRLGSASQRPSRLAAQPKTPADRARRD